MAKDKAPQEPKKLPGFIQKVLKSNQENGKILRDKMQGEDVLYAGDPALHWGTGGYMRGRATLFYGKRGAGKSTLALKGAAAEQQKTGGWVVIFDSERYYADPHEVNDETGEPTPAAIKIRARLAKCGLNWEKVIIKSSSHASILFGDLKEFADTLKLDPRTISAIVVDSWGGVQSSHAARMIEEGTIDKAGQKYGGNSKTIGPIVQYILDVCAEAGVAQFYVQHCMDNPDGWPKYILLGGNKLQFLVHTIIFLEPSNAKDAHLLSGDEVSKEHADAQENIRVGKKIMFTCEKSRLVVEGRRGEFFFNFETCEFALPAMSLFNMANKLKLLNQSGAWYSYPKTSPTPFKAQGASKFVEAMTSDKNLYDDIWKECLACSSMDATGGFEFGSVGVGAEDDK